MLLLLRHQILPKNISFKTERIYHALVTGIGTISGKQGFTKAILGLSGGIDSALVTVLATRALGPENVKVLLLCL